MVSTQGIFRTLLLLFILATSALPTAATTVDALSLYNQACDASLAGQTDSAQVLFQQALQAGFDDLRYALSDPDLDNLRASSEFKDLLLNHQSNLTLLSSERGLELESQQWTPWTELEASSGTNQQPATMRLQWQPLGLDFEVKLSGEMATAFNGTTAPPASGGPSMMITLAILDGTSPYESTNSFHFLFGKNKTSGMGALYLGNGWQPVNELTPNITSPVKDQILLSGTITWQTILPYHPLVDTTLGLNIALQSGGAENHTQTLFPDPQALAPGSEFHRFVPAIFDLGSTDYEAMVGHMSQSVVSDDPLQCDLNVLSFETGTGYLQMDFLDEKGQSVLDGGARPVPMELQSGVNSLTQSADFRALKLGPYLVKVDLELPSGNTMTWSSLVLNMGPHWQTNFQQRIDKLSAQDQPTADFYMHTVESAIDLLASRRHPGSLTTTLLELDAFVIAGTASGSILPNSGVFILVWNDSLGQERFCSLYLPVGYKKNTGLEPVVLWANAAGVERRLAARIGKFAEYPRKSPIPAAAEDKKTPIYLVPHSPEKPYASLDAEVADMHAFLQWVESYFQTEATALAGMNAASGAVLDFSRLHPEMLSRILIYSGALLDPWPQANASFLESKFPAKPKNYPPLTWIDFFRETQAAGQGQLLLSVLDKAGYIHGPVEKVKGGLSLTQVGDRLVLWVE